MNVSVDLQLKKIGWPDSQLQRGKNKTLIPIEMTVSAVNPSSRTVYLFPSVWLARGSNVTPLPENQELTKQITSYLNMSVLSQIERHDRTYNVSAGPVAIGRLFVDTFLRPNEKVTRKIVFHLPPGQYDLIEVHAIVPTYAKRPAVIFGSNERLRSEWKYDEKTGKPYIKIYRSVKNGEPKEIGEDKYGTYSDAAYEIQETESISTLSLWQ